MRKNILTIKLKEAQNVYGTTEVDHPGVKRVYEKESLLAGPIHLVARPKHDEFNDFHLDPTETRAL